MTADAVKAEFVAGGLLGLVLWIRNCSEYSETMSSHAVG